MAKTVTGQVLCLPDYRPQRGGLGGGVQRVCVCVCVCVFVCVRACVLCVCVCVCVCISVTSPLNTSAEYFAMVVEVIADLLEVGVV